MGIRQCAAKETTCPKIFRVGVFFDGTGNNRFNDAADPDELKMTSLEDWFKIQRGKKADLSEYNKGKPAGQREDRRSNVAKLFAIYRQERFKDPATGKSTITRAIYKEGVGTNAGATDGWPVVNTMPIFDKGKGEYLAGRMSGAGGALRINEAIEEIERLLDQHPEQEFERLIDVFGFSRGAAQVRDFVNTFNKLNKGEPYSFAFIGIFDTVGSFGFGGNNENYKPKDPKKDTEFGYIGASLALRKNRYIPYNFHLASESAERILHLIADDEFRKTFPLSDISRSQHAEWRYIGAHSDVGGGYANEFENHNLSKDIVETHTVSALQVNRIQLIAKSAEDRGLKIAASSSLGGTTTLYVYRERFVHPDLSKVAMKNLHNDAICRGVPFEAVLPDKKEYKIPKDLQPYADYAERYRNDTTGYCDREHIKESYAHRSHSNALSGTIDKATMYPGRVGGEMQRTVFANDPAMAIIRS